MFAGHVGAAMLIGCAERRVNVGAFIVAALLLDVLLWLFILLGWESVKIPTNFASSHQPEFVFPYSHSLVASFGWSALMGGAAFVWGSGSRSAFGSRNGDELTGHSHRRLCTGLLAREASH